MVEEHICVMQYCFQAPLENTIDYLIVVQANIEIKHQYFFIIIWQDIKDIPKTKNKIRRQNLHIIHKKNQKKSNANKSTSQNM